MRRWNITALVYASPVLLLCVLVETSLNEAYPSDGDSLGIPLFSYLIFCYPVAISLASEIRAAKLTRPKVMFWNPKRNLLSFFSLALSIFPLGLLWLQLLFVAVGSKSYASVLICSAMLFATGAVRTYAIQSEPGIEQPVADVASSAAAP
jgi:hypothetical protein